MTFADIPVGTALYLDTNVPVYFFTAHPTLGRPCGELLERVDRKEGTAFIAASGISNLAHRLMTYEAVGRFGGAMTGVVRRLKNNPTEVQALSQFRLAIDRLLDFGVQVLPVGGTDVTAAADLSVQYGLLSEDALVAALMRAHGLTELASHDADFDRVPGLTRYAPA